MWSKVQAITKSVMAENEIQNIYILKNHKRQINYILGYA